MTAASWRTRLLLSAVVLIAIFTVLSPASQATGGSVHAPSATGNPVVSSVARVAAEPVGAPTARAATTAVHGTLLPASAAVSPVAPDSSFSPTPASAGGGGPSGGPNGVDYSAFAPSGTLIGSAVGSFPSSYDLTSEDNTGSGGNCAPGTANCFSLQLNTQVYPFEATAATGTGDYTSSWQQFVYESQPGSSLVYIQYVLIGSIPAKSGCTGTVAIDGIVWKSYSSQPSICYGFSPSQSVPSKFFGVPVTDLVLTAQADYEGSSNDLVQICGTPSSGLGCATALTMPDDVLDAAPNWDGAEFNVFGDAGGSQANFNTGTTLSVLDTLQTQSGDSIAPTCYLYSGTGETDNLWLGPCSSNSTSIFFTEASIQYSVSVSPSDVTVLRGQTASFQVTVTLINGVTEPVTLSVVAGLPGLATPTFTANPLTPTVSTTLSISTSLFGPLGDFQFVVQGQYGGLINNTTANLHVYDFTTSLSPSSITVLRGNSATYTVTLKLLSGSSTTGIPAEVLSASGLPSDSTHSFSPTTITPTTGGASGTLKVSTHGPPTGSLGDFTIRVTATDPKPSGGSRTSGSVGLHIFDFAVILTPISQTTLRGTTTYYALTLKLLTGSSTVGIPAMSMSVSGGPSDTVLTLSAASMTPTVPGCSVSTPADCQTVTASTAGPPSGSLGNFTFQVTAADPAGGSRSTVPPGQLHIFDFTVALVPAVETLVQGGSVPMTVTLTLIPGSTNIALPIISTSLVGLPSDVVAVGFPPTMAIGETAHFLIESASVAGYVNCPQVRNGGDQELIGADLAHCNLAGYDLAGDLLLNANLLGANLASADLADADLSNANLASANLMGTDFQGADLKGADLSSSGPVGLFGISAVGSVDGGSRASGISLLQVLGDELSGDDFEGADLEGANLTWTVLTGYIDDFTDFGQADLDGANLTAAICGSPNNITAPGVQVLGIIDLPSSCNPPLGLALGATLVPASLGWFGSPQFGVLGASMAALAVVLALMVRRRPRRPRSHYGREEPVVARDPSSSNTRPSREEVLHRARAAREVLIRQGELDSAAKLDQTVEMLAELSRSSPSSNEP